MCKDPDTRETMTLCLGFQGGHLPHFTYEETETQRMSALQSASK